MESSDIDDGIDLLCPSASTGCISLNDYKGYEPPIGVSHSIDRIGADISPKEFFEKYVLSRRPVIIEQLLVDEEWKRSNWTNTYLEEQAGKVQVLVEKRVDVKTGAFGLSAPKVEMTYGEFLKELKNKNELYYLTTQDLERFQDDLDEFDMPKSTLAEPLKSLKENFPLRPSLLGNLIPYQLSLWQGISKDGASSGLHHDFHDNLYLLVRGRKRFRLFPPSSAPNMRTMGRPIKIHSNGLIVYQSRAVNPTVNIRSDGVPLAFLARRKRIEAEQELAIAEEELYCLQDSPGIPEAEKEAEIKRLQGIILDCEDRIDLAMEEMLQYGNTFDYDNGSDADIISIHGDDSELDEPVAEKTGKAEETALDDDDDDDHGDGPPPAKVMKLANGSHAILNVNKGKDKKNDCEKYLKIPDHFCNIVLPSDMNDMEEFLSKFSDPQNVRCLCVELKEGEMLYLPASWFHEVMSYSDDAPVMDDKMENEVDSSGHLAFNYWMFPPDGDKFLSPYRDDFWTKRWEDIQDEKDDLFVLSDRVAHKYLRPGAIQDVINLDSDSEGDDDAIVVGDDSLQDERNKKIDRSSIVIDSQSERSTTQKSVNEMEEVRCSPIQNRMEEKDEKEEEKKMQNDDVDVEDEAGDAGSISSQDPGKEKTRNDIDIEIDAALKMTMPEETFERSSDKERIIENDCISATHGDGDGIDSSINSTDL